MTPNLELHSARALRTFVTRTHARDHGMNSLSFLFHLQHCALEVESFLDLREIQILRGAKNP